MVRLLDLTPIRVGNDEYARLNRSFGLTTLRDRHAKVEGGSSGSGSAGNPARSTRSGFATADSRGLVRRCQELPGQELFQYVDDDGEVRDVVSDDVNDYIREAAGGEFTAKDFRTWAGTVLAYRALRPLQPADGERGAKRNVVEAIRQTADPLGNTPAVARGSYVHPAVLEAYLEGSIRGALVQAAEGQASTTDGSDSREESAVRALLRQRLEDDAAAIARARRSGRSEAKRVAPGKTGQAADS